LQSAQKLARSYTTEAVEALVRGLKDPKHYVAAASALLDRGWGRPTQPIAGDGERPVAIHFTWGDATPAMSSGEAEYVGREAPQPMPKSPSTVIDAVLVEPQDKPLTIEWENTSEEGDGAARWKQ
jgi:hypothetical protein